jgi:hypothetical protein
MTMRGNFIDVDFANYLKEVISLYNLNFNEQNDRYIKYLSFIIMQIIILKLLFINK